jgi:hypothetical protein
MHRTSPKSVVPAPSPTAPFRGAACVMPLPVKKARPR